MSKLATPNIGHTNTVAKIAQDADFLLNPLRTHCSLLSEYNTRLAGGDMRFIGEVGAKLQLLLCKPGWKGHALLLDLLVATDANVTMGNGASAISLPNWIAQKIVIKQTETTGIAKELGAFRRSDIIQCCAQQSSATRRGCRCRSLEGGGYAGSTTSLSPHLLPEMRWLNFQE